MSKLLNRYLPGMLPKRQPHIPWYTGFWSAEVLPHQEFSCSVGCEEYGEKQPAHTAWMQTGSSQGDKRGGLSLCSAHALSNQTLVRTCTAPDLKPRQYLPVGCFGLMQCLVQKIGAKSDQLLCQQVRIAIVRCII